MYIPHELRTPLVAIMGYSQLILSEIEIMGSKEIKETTERILWSANRLHSRIEKFIAYSDLDLPFGSESISNGKTATRFTNEFVSNIIMGHYLLNERAFSIKLKIEPVLINIRETQIARLLKELIENAAKYSDSNSEIIVSGEKGIAGYNLTVTDYGIGMDKKEIESIGVFQQFSREAHSQEGNGLGLAICKKIVQMHNGILSIESEKGKFTTVKVVIPLQ